MTRLMFKRSAPFVILLMGIGLGALFLNNPDEAQKRQAPLVQDLLVETGAAEFGTYTVHVETMGRVIPAMEISLKPQISGEIILAADEFIPGGFFKKGEPMLHIDPEDYELTVKKQEALLKQAEADYKIEMGRQDIARDELEILARTTDKKLKDTALALRAPQREQAIAERDKAQSDLDMAKLALRRTNITAPFNALVTTRHATRGDKVTPQDTLASLVNTDEYWIDLSVPVNKLQWLKTSEQGKDAVSSAKIIMDGARGQRKGRFLKLAGKLDPGSRFAEILVSVADPLLLNTDNKDNKDNKDNEDNKAPLILNDYVQVILEGKELNNAARVPLSWVREGNIIYVLKEDNVLEFRPVTLVYEDKHYAYITSGLLKNDRIIFSNIPVPVDGMKVKVIHVPL